MMYLQSCYDQGIHVACTCFDGQWFRLAVRDANDKPLTLLQLQKDVHAEARATARHTNITKILGQKSSYEVGKEDGKWYINCPMLGRFNKRLRMGAAQKHIPKDMHGDAEVTSAEHEDVGCLPQEAIQLFQDAKEDEDLNELLAGMNLVSSEDTEQNVEADLQPALTNDEKDHLPLEHTELIAILYELQHHSKKKISAK